MVLGAGCRRWLLVAGCWLAEGLFQVRSTTPYRTIPGQSAKGGENLGSLPYPCSIVQYSSNLDRYIQYSDLFLNVLRAKLQSQ